MADALLRAGARERISAIRGGLSYRLFEELLEELDVTAAELGHVIQVPPRTLQRRRQEGVFPVDESDRLF